MKVFGAVFARGGSKTLPNKNLRTVGGVSLLGRAISLGKELPMIDQMLLSSDSKEIAAEAKRFGATIPFLRPPGLSADETPEWKAWQHLAAYLLEQGASPSDVLISLPATAPLRLGEDVENAFAEFMRGSFDLVLSVTTAHRSPWFNMVTRDITGEVKVVIDTDAVVVTRRQDAPEVFSITTVCYVTTLGYVVSGEGLFSGSVGSTMIPVERSIDIDTQLDLEIANFLFQRSGGASL